MNIDWLSGVKISRFFITICPALIDWLLFLTNFAVLYRAGEQHLTLNQCAWMAGIWPLFYMLTSLGAGFVISRRNAWLILVVSTAFTVLATILCLVAAQFQTLLIGMAILGIFSAFFFNSFQAFMRGESAPGGLMKTIGIYTLSWSMGTGFGFISSGFFYRYGVYTLAILSLTIGLIIIIIIIRHKRRPLQEISSEEHIEQGPSGAGPVNIRYVWVGWIIIFTAVFVQKPLASFFPSICAAEGISPFMASLPLFLNSTVQALAGLAMFKWRNALYRRAPFVIMHFLAAILFFMVWKRPAMSVCFPVFSLLGIYFGFAYFCSVYYSSNSGNRAFNVGINEFLVGTASMLGLFVSEWWMRHTASAASMYAVCGVMLALSAVVQFFAASPGRKTTNFQ
ncbi:MAG: MFS transporter [Kiritimatiellia bacterium]|nr:MFS transporter [Kiritimatiellia bacterium]